MAAIFITPEAEKDLVNIWRYIAQDNTEAADRVFQAAEITFKALVATPGMGTSYRSKRARLKGVRFFPVSKFQSYIIYYREHSKGIEIIRVLHGSHGQAKTPRAKRVTPTIQG